MIDLYNGDILSHTFSSFFFFFFYMLPIPVCVSKEEPSHQQCFHITFFSDSVAHVAVKTLLESECGSLPLTNQFQLC